MDSAGTRFSQDLSLYLRLVRYLKPQLSWFFLAVIGFLIAAGSEAYFARLLGDIVDAFDDPSEGVVWVFPLLMSGTALVRAVGAITGDFLLSRISFRVVHVIRCQLFESLLSLPSAFFDRSTHGQLVSRLTYNTVQLRDTVTDALKILIQDGGKVVVLLAFMLYESWILTLIFLAIAPIVGAVVGYASRRFRRISARIQGSMGEVTHVASEAVSGYRVMRSFGGESYERERFFSASDRNRSQNLKMVATKAITTQLIQLFVACALALLVSLLLRPEVAGAMTVGGLVAYLGYAGLLANPIKKLSEVNARLQRGLAAAEDIFWQLDQPSEKDGGTLSVDRVKAHVEFRHVFFGYEGSDKDVLSDVSFVVEPGETAAIIGRSGGGKSTLAGLIPRFYDVERGEILIDRIPLNTYRLDNLRDQIALVTQNVTLFNGTLRQNIAYGSLAGASDAEVEQAAHRAHLNQFVRNLPKGLDTVIGDNGVLLSGGQRQRVAIARALLKDAPLLILDEATSSLDTESEWHIKAALDEVMRGRTTIVIAHRLSTIENADVILVVEDGRIVETGGHEDLLNTNGSYTKLHASEFSQISAEDAQDRLTPDVSNEVILGEREGEVANAIVVMPGPASNVLAQAWYENRFWPRFLLPLASMFSFFARRRRARFLSGKSESWRSPVPIVIVGNITVGGTGKSPLVMWLANWLKNRGLRVGIISRGYGGDAQYPLTVFPDTSSVEAGDEAAMIARQTACPVVVDPDRVTAVKHLLGSADCDVVLSDDGLQHYPLARDIEIAVIDGYRGIGNGLFLPAGPLREPVSRLGEVDLVVTNGEKTGLIDNEFTMKARATKFRNLMSDEIISAEQFAERVSGPLFAFSGIGNPDRFHYTLSELGLVPVVRVFPDHHVFSRMDLEVPMNAWVVVTEKDAQKIYSFSNLPTNCWVLEIVMEPEGAFSEAVEVVFRRHGLIS